MAHQSSPVNTQSEKTDSIQPTNLTAGVPNGPYSPLNSFPLSSNIYENVICPLLHLKNSVIVHPPSANPVNHFAKFFTPEYRVRRDMVNEDGTTDVTASRTPVYTTDDVQQ
jgi:hypothetical protein